MDLLIFLLHVVLPIYLLGAFIAWTFTEAHELTCRIYESRTKRQRLLRILSWPTLLIRSIGRFLKEAAKGE